MAFGVLETALAASAAASAFAGGCLLGRAVVSWRRRARHRAVLLEASEGVPRAASRSSLAAGIGRTGAPEDSVIAYAIEMSQKMRSPLMRPLSPRLLRQRVGAAGRAALAGVEGRLTDEGFWEARTRLALAGAVAGGAAGCLVTIELGICLGLAGFVLGWRALPWALSERSRHRAEVMERDLSELLGVVALGMRSGLSFDRSLELYTGHFDTMLADTFRTAHRQWACGLVSRGDSLRAVAASYDSPLLGRVIENVIRSLRFGSALADTLEDAAREARSGYKARKQEQVAKAPVKMMVPTGVLILPAMLMLVLGPVLLELAGGF